MIPRCSTLGGGLAALLLSLTLTAGAGAAPLGADTTAVISGTPDLLSVLATPAGSADSGRQSVSGNGLRVVFSSTADGLVAGDDDDVRNVYVKSLDTGTVELVSRASDGQPSHDECSGGVISRDGRQVAFTCESGLDPADTNNLRDVYVRNLDTQTTTLISRAPGGAVSDGTSFDPVIAASAGRTFVAFTSTARNLLPGQQLNDDQPQVFRRTIGSGSDAMDLISKNGDPAGPRQGEAQHPSISNDGTRVAFDTLQKLDAADTSGVRDVYVRDLGATPPQSRLVSPSQVQSNLNDISQSPVISGDGSAVAYDVTHFEAGVGTTRNVHLRVLAQGAPTVVSAENGTSGNGDSFVTGIDDGGTVVGFESAATNFDPADTTTQVDGYVFLTGPGEVRLVSRGGGAGPVSPTGTRQVAVSGDGTKVVMPVVTPSIVDDHDLRFGAVVLRDLATGANQTVSRPPGAEPFVNAGGSAAGGSVSADGRFVAFDSDATGLAAGLGDREIFVRDVVTGAVTLVSRGPDGVPLAGIAFDPQLSADGRRVAFSFRAGPGETSQVFVRDIPSGSTLLISAAPDGALGDASSDQPSISDDGSRVAFQSRAGNLAAGDADAEADVYVREVDGGRTTLVSLAAGTGLKVAGSSSSNPAISGNGRSVAFHTEAALVDGDVNGEADVYVRDLDPALTRLVSVAGQATQGDQPSVDASISRDGNRVAFISLATNFGGGPGTKLLVRDLATGTLTIAARADGPDGAPVTRTIAGLISADGTSVAFLAEQAMPIAPGEPGGGEARVYQRSLTSGATRLISRESGAAGAALGSPSSADLGGITADGRCVTFTAAGRFGPSGSGDASNVFMRALTADCKPPVDPRIQPTPPGPAKAAVLSGLKLKPARFHVGGRKGGTKILFRLDKRSAVSLRFDRLLPGHRAKAKRGKVGRCSTKVRRGKRCTVAKLAGRRTVAASRTRGGANTIAFSGKLGRKALKPGRYRLTATPLKGTARTVSFTVVKAPKAKPKPRRRA